MITIKIDESNPIEEYDDVVQLAYQIAQSYVREEGGNVATIAGLMFDNLKEQYANIIDKHIQTLIKKDTNKVHTVF